MPLDTSHEPSWRLNRNVGLEEALTLPRIAIEAVEPVVDGGRFAAKAISGQPVTVSAVIFADGHDQLAAERLWRPVTYTRWQRVPLTFISNDHWDVEL